MQENRLGSAGETAQVALELYVPTETWGILGNLIATPQVQPVTDRDDPGRC
jgi:hypothetical protein